MGKLARRRKNGARLVGVATVQAKGYDVRVQLPFVKDPEIAERIARHEKSAEEKRKRRAELRAAQNRPWPTKMPEAPVHNGGATMTEITAEFYNYMHALRNAEASVKVQPAKRAG